MFLYIVFIPESKITNFSYWVSNWQHFLLKRKKDDTLSAPWFRSILFWRGSNNNSWFLFSLSISNDFFSIFVSGMFGSTNRNLFNWIIFSVLRENDFWYLNVQRNVNVFYTRQLSLIWIIFWTIWVTKNLFRKLN